MIKNLIIIILLLIIGFAVYNKLLSLRYKEKIKIVTVVEEKEVIIRDTVEIGKPTIVYRDKYTPRKLPVSIKSPYSNKIDSIEVRLPIHVYTDTIVKDSSSFAYNIEVEGYLKHFDYDFRTYSRTITNTETITKTKNRFIDLYGIGGFREVPYVGLDLSIGRYKAGYRIDLQKNPIHHFELGYRLWDF